jgi:hypothetical protein
MELQLLICFDFRQKWSFFPAALWRDRLVWIRADAAGVDQPSGACSAL